MKSMVLDIGGTAIKSAICEDGVLSDIRETPTKASLGGLHVVTRVQAIICDYQDKYTFDQIGICSAGLVNPLDGSIIFSNQNIPGYTGTKVKELLENYFHLPVFVQNDGNCTAIAEASFGAGQGENDFVSINYGTGIGGAIFVNGRLFSGSNFCAGEFGAIITHPEKHDPKTDFFSGCYEKYASTNVLIRKARNYHRSLLNGRTIFSKLDDPEVRKIVDDWIMEVVYGLSAIVHMMNPSCLILGGGIMEQPYVQEQVREKLYENIMPGFRHVKVCSAKLGSHAGLLGASILHLQKYKEIE